MPSSNAIVSRFGRCHRRGFRPPQPIRRVVAALALMIGAASFASEGPATAPPLKKSINLVGMNRLAFSRLNENDAKAAYKALCIEVGRKLGYDLTIEMSLFDSLPDFAQAIRAGKVNFIAANTWDFLNMDVGDAVEIKFSPSTSGSLLHRWLFLVRRGSGLKHLADLKGQTVIALRNNTSSLGLPWIETCLLEQGLAPPEKLFGTLEFASKPSAAVLPVFFGKAQACIIDQASFDTMVEMNPQVGQMLEAVMQSEPMLNAIVGLSRNGWVSAEARDDMVRGLQDLDQEPSGRQILTLFKTDRLVAFEPAQLESVRRLFDRHRQLLSGQKP